MRFSDRAIARRARWMQRAFLAGVPSQRVLRLCMEADSQVFYPRLSGTLVQRARLGGVPALHIRPPGVAEGAPRLLYLHGGGFTIGSARTHLGLVSHLAAEAGAEAWSLDYRLAPENPAPAAWEDARTAFDALSPDFVAGDSAGGTLALHLGARRRFRALGLLSPLVDQTRLAGADFTTELLIPRSWARRIARALAAANPADPELSPIHDDLAAAPPTLIQAARGEVLEDDAHRAAKALPAATLSLYDGVPHVWQLYGRRNPSAERALAEMGRFFRDHAA